MKRPIDHFRNFWCADFFFLDLDSAVAQNVTLFVFYSYKFRFRFKHGSMELYFYLHLAKTCYTVKFG